MSLWHIAWSYLWNRKLTTFMTIISVALAVGLITAVLTLREETRKRFEEEGQEFDMVVGAKGNPLQLVLSAVYYLDAPTGNIHLSDLEYIKRDERVRSAFPINLGDSYRGQYRIVGTSREFMDVEFVRTERQPFALAKGRYFETAMEAVVGASVAENEGLEIGKTFVGTHGFVDSPYAHVHENQPYTVVGIMERSGTPNDRAIFCSLDSVWKVHQHDAVDDMYVDPDAEDGDQGGEHAEGEHDESHEGEHDHEHAHEHNPDDPMVTAVLVMLHSPAMRFQFKTKINNNLNAMAAVPIQEIQKLYDQLLGTAKAVLLAIGYLVVVISSLSILIGLYLSILQRKRDLAIMRALGASSGEIFGSVIIEAFWVTVLGLAAGWALGCLVCWGLSSYLVTKIGFTASAVTLTADMVTAYSAVILMGMVAGVLPAWQAYRTDVARDLAEL